MTRDPIKNRRWGIVLELSHTLDGMNQIDFSVTYGVDGHARVREVFVKPSKIGAELSNLMHQVGMALSLGLQHGATMEDFAHTLGEDEPDKPAKSILGVIVRAGTHLDRELAA